MIAGGFFGESVFEVGEETGDLDEVALRLANNSSYESERKFDSFAGWFPKFIYCLVAGMMIIQILQGFAMVYGGAATF